MRFGGRGGGSEVCIEGGGKEQSPTRGLWIALLGRSVIIVKPVKSSMNLNADSESR